MKSERCSLFTLVALLTLHLAAATCGNTTFELRLDQEGQCKVYVCGLEWLRCDYPYVTLDGTTYSAQNGSGLKLNATKHVTGSDTLGPWRGTTLVYSTENYRLFTITYLIYDLFPNAVIFEQHFGVGGNGTNTGSPDFASSGFPRFHVGGQETELGYFQYGGMMAGDTTKWMGRWNEKTFNLRDGIVAGPLAVFDKSNNVLLITPFDQFMVNVIQRDRALGGTLSWGLMGSVTSLPPDFQMRTVLYYGSSGINEAFDGWGKMMREYYGRHDNFMKTDLVVNYLGYWTDNGSYYYYLTEENKTYDETLFDVQKYAHKMKIPYRYVQYDSWWYHQGPMYGVTRWEAREDIFPRGMQYVYNTTGWPVVAHNRWWSSETPYAKQNGGSFNFLMDVFKSIPFDESFWEWLFTRSRKWGLITYEQDWMNAQTLGVPGLLTDVTAARTWLMLMGKGAAKTGITLQYCMSNPRHVLQSLEIPTVTQVRVSDDYSPGKEDWRVGVTTIFAHALRLAPYKDTFWTTSVQPGNPYGLDREETHPGLMAAGAVLCGGPVGPGDAIGYTDRPLLMRCCNEDGLILKADKPATAIDRQMWQAAFRDGSGPAGEVWTAYSRVSGLYFGLVLAAALSPDWTITPAATGFTWTQTDRIFRDNMHHPTKAVPFDDNHNLMLRNCTRLKFCLYHTLPVLHLRGQELLLYGEISKWVPMSSKRILEIAQADSHWTVKLKGGVGETIHFWYSLGGTVNRAHCSLAESGTVILHIPDNTCTPC